MYNTIPNLHCNIYCVCVCCCGADEYNIYFLDFSFSPADKPVKLKKVKISKIGTLELFKDKTLKDCNEACYQYEGCNSYEYNKNDKLCNLSNVTQLTDELRPNDGAWDVYVIASGQLTIYVLFTCSYVCVYLHARIGWSIIYIYIWGLDKITETTHFIA